MEPGGNSVWCIAYIDSELVTKVDRMIAKTGLPIKAQIPTIKLLTKRFKGKLFFVHVPLLFNYGFFKIPLEMAHSMDKLEQIKARVPVIFSWLYTHTDKQVDEEGHYIPRMQVETISFREIARLKRIALVESVYSAKDIDNLQEGSFIVLHGYPFDNMPAEVLSINTKKEEVKVRLLFETFARELTVKFANIFYTVYTDYQDPKTKDSRSIEGILERSKFKLEKLYFEDYDEE